VAETIDPALRPGTMLGPWRIERRLGGGGVGAVYAAEDPSIRKRVAIKVLRAALADDPAAAARFEREARAANDVRHPGIVDVLALGKLDDGRPYLVMSLLDGRSLREELSARGALPVAEAWRVTRQIAEALAAAHAEGIVHRDVKPDNVFLERAGSGEARARVLDFGLAKVEENVDGEPLAKLTQTGVPMGTPAYMAPEQWWGRVATQATDQYALGATLFELVTGRPPFPSPHFAELLQQHLHQAPPRLGDAGLAVPEAVEALVARALAKAPEDRFASMEALVEAGDRAFADVPPSLEAAAPATREAQGDGLATAPTVVARSGADLATSKTELASGASAAIALAPAAGEGLARFAAVYAALLALGLGAIVGVGYAGPGRRDVREWLHIAGLGGSLAALLGVVAAMGVALVARRRARTGAGGTGPFWLALAPALVGGVATYGGWQVIRAHADDWAATVRFTTFAEGMYEANAGRFVGQAFAALIALGLVALGGVGPHAPAGEPQRRLEIGALAGFVLVAIVAGLAGAPSGALVAGVAAAAVGTRLALPRRGTLDREVERAVAGVLAVALAAAVGLARVEAREAVLWDEAPTRAARAAEVIAAAAERAATTGVVAVVLVAFVALELARLASLRAHAALGRPRPATIALAALLAGAIGVDQVAHARADAKHEELRAAMAKQFSLFAELDPPSGDALAAGAGAGGPFAPHHAAALQVARRALGVDAVPTAPVGALESAEGALNLGRDLAHAIADAAAKADPGDPTLSIAIDRDVPWRTASRALEVARRAGARRVELLLTRGPRPDLGHRGPVEASWVVPSDFVALPADLGDAGFAPADDARFGDVAPELARRALAGEVPVRLAVR
jgi:tRNA A-37 threonylcarbamoyl transferase component Bud32